MNDSFTLKFQDEVQSASGVWYKTLERLGEGGNATTYLMLARTGPNRGVPFAVKFFRRLSRPEWKESFLREGEFLKTCSHPAIMRYFDGGIAREHHPFFVAEFLPLTLREVIRNGRTSTVRKLSYASQLISALVHLASWPEPVLHRDIKPENIFVKGESAVLGDFGLLKFLPSAADDLDQLNSSVGPGMPRGYRTPELVEYLTSGVTLSGKSDVYQLGLVLAELFCGKNPQRPLSFDADFREPIDCEEVGPISIDGGSVIRSLIQRMLEPDTAIRPNAIDLIELWQGHFFEKARLARALDGRIF